MSIAQNSPEQAYQEALDWIYSWIDFSMKRHVDDAHRFFKLDRMNKLMALLDLPQNSFPSIHIAGTKGKGSTASFCACALEDSGYKVGLYTSPHLEEFNERIRVNGQCIDKQSVVELCEQLKPLTELVPELTTFELTTALAFLYFQREAVDIAVIEVGLGGRLDATNVITPLVSVITSISYDHTAVLGNTLTEIAFEKGGIIKDERPLVMAPQYPEAQAELLRLTTEHQAQLVPVENAYHFQAIGHTLKAQQMRISSRDPQSKSLVHDPLTLSLPLLGYHQIENASTALAALDVLYQKGYAIPREALQSGFARVNWPARFEMLRETPPIIADSAHNGDSMQKLRQSIDEYFPDLPFVLVFGSSNDKLIDAMLQAILPRVESVICTQSQHPRAMPPQELAEHMRFYKRPIEICPTAEEALARALELANDQKGILITGSIFIAAAARAIWAESRSSSPKKEP